MVKPTPTTTDRRWRGEFLVPNQSGTPGSGAGKGAGPSLPPLLAATHAAARCMEAGIVESRSRCPRCWRPATWRAPADCARCYHGLGRLSDARDRARLPLLRIDVAARLRESGVTAGSANGGWMLAFLHLVTEGALARPRELGRLEALAEAAAAPVYRCDCTSNSALRPPTFPARSWRTS